MSVKNNIPRFYLYRIFQCQLYFIPVFILYYFELGLNTTQALSLEAFFAIIVISLEMPSGIFADKFSRKLTLNISSLCLLIGTLIFALSQNLIHLIIANIFYAFALSLWSGTDSAFIYDSLIQLGKSNDFKKVYGNINFTNFLVWGISALIGSQIATISIRSTFFASLLPLTIGFLISLTFTEPQFTKSINFGYSGHLKDIIRIFKSHFVVRFILIFSMVLFGVSEAMWVLNQPLFQSVGLEIHKFGYIYFAILVMTAISAKFAYKIEKKIGIVNSLFIMVLVPCIVYFILGIVATKILVLLKIFSAMIFGMQYPIIEDIINKRVESKHRATMISTKNFSIQVFYALTAPFFGYIVDIWNISTALLLASAIILINLILLIIYRRKLIKILEYTN